MCEHLFFNTFYLLYNLNRIETSAVIIEKKKWNLFEDIYETNDFFL